MTNISGLSALSAVKVFRAGTLFVTVAVKQWVFTPTAIGEAELAGSTNAGLYLFYVLATQTLVLPPILMYVVAQQRAARPLEAVRGWLERHNSPIVVVVPLIFGVWFLYKGLTGLIG